MTVALFSSCCFEYKAIVLRLRAELAALQKENLNALKYSSAISAGKFTMKNLFEAPTNYFERGLAYANVAGAYAQTKATEDFQQLMALGIIKQNPGESNEFYQQKQYAMMKMLENRALDEAQENEKKLLYAQDKEREQKILAIQSELAVAEEKYKSCKEELAKCIKEDSGFSLKA